MGYKLQVTEKVRSQLFHCFLHLVIEQNMLQGREIKKATLKIKSWKGVDKIREGITAHECMEVRCFAFYF